MSALGCLESTLWYWGRFGDPWAASAKSSLDGSRQCMGTFCSDPMGTPRASRQGPASGGGAPWGPSSLGPSDDVPLLASPVPNAVGCGLANSSVVCRLAFGEQPLYAAVPAADLGRTPSRRFSVTSSDEDPWSSPAPPPAPVPRDISAVLAWQASAEEPLESTAGLASYTPQLPRWPTLVRPGGPAEAPGGEEEIIARFLGVIGAATPPCRAEVPEAPGGSTVTPPRALGRGAQVTPSTASPLCCTTPAVPPSTAAGLTTPRRRSPSAPGGAFALYQTPEPGEHFKEGRLEACGSCGRRFQEDRLPVHEAICRARREGCRLWSVFESRRQRCGPAGARWWEAESEPRAGLRSGSRGRPWSGTASSPGLAAPARPHGASPAQSTPARRGRRTEGPSPWAHTSRHSGPGPGKEQEPAVIRLPPQTTEETPATGAHTSAAGVFQRIQGGSSSNMALAASFSAAASTIPPEWPAAVMLADRPATEHAATAEGTCSADAHTEVGLTSSAERRCSGAGLGGTWSRSRAGDALQGCPAEAQECFLDLSSQLFVHGVLESMIEDVAALNERVDKLLSRRHHVLGAAGCGRQNTSQ